MPMDRIRFLVSPGESFSAIRLKCSLPVIALLIFAGVALGQDATSTGTVLPTHHYYFTERVDWTLDGSRLLIRTSPDVAHEQVKEIASAAGVAVVDVIETGYSAWHLLSLDPPAPSAGVADQQIARLLGEPQIEFASPVFFGAVPGSWVGMTQEILLRFHPDTFPARHQMPGVLAELAPELEIHTTRFAGLAGAFRLGSDLRNGFEVLALANRLAENRSTEFAEPNAMFSGRADYTPNDPGYEDLWGIHNTGQMGGTQGIDMDVDVAWNASLGGVLSPVLVLDAGVELTHPDLLIGGGADFTNGASTGGGPVNACDNHGTAVAGCISAIINNGLGTVGVAPRSPVYSARCFISTVPCSGSWTTMASSTANALNWGLAQGCRVSNNSNWYGFTSSSISSAYSSTKAAGMVHFASAGNSASPSITYPASLTTVNALAALEPSGALTWFSNFGAGLAFAAPGISIYTTDRTGSDGYSGLDYVFMAGTSFSSPYAAGVAAILIASNPTLSSTQVESAMQDAATDLGAPGYDTVFGHGLPNAARTALPPGLAPYGTGTQGCSGPHTHSASTEPTIGNPAFAIDCNAGPPNTTGWLAVGGTQDLAGSIILGALFHVPLGSGTQLFPVTADANGESLFSVAIPLNASLIGLTVYTQYIWIWPGSICTPSVPRGLGTSNGLAITIL